jgi:hypothetical protein
VPFLVNWLGEFSNAVINKNLASLALTRTIDAVPFMGTEDLGIGDIAFFLQASLSHKLVFIHEYLGCFRMNPKQHTAQLQSHGMKEQFLGWAALAVASARLGKLSRQEAFQAFKGVERRVHGYYCDRDADMKRFGSLIAGYSELSDDLIEKFCAEWRGFLSVHNRDSLTQTASG